MLTFQLIFVTVFVALAAEAVIAPTIKAKQVMHLINIVCSPKKYLCPKEEFAFFEEDGNYEWNEEAVLSDSHGKMLRGGLLEIRSIGQFIRDNFCCTEGACLSLCGIYPIQEIEIIKAFPKNVDLIFSLNFPGLEEFREPVYTFLKNNEHIRKPFPAVIEEYFDFLHKHRHALEPLVHEAASKNRMRNAPSFFN